MMDHIKEIALRFFEHAKYDNYFHDLMLESWEQKIKTSNMIKNEAVSTAIQLAQKNGAKSWKLFGAGGAGFLGAFFNTPSEAKYAQKIIAQTANVFTVKPNMSGMRVYDFR